MYVRLKHTSVLKAAFLLLLFISLLPGKPFLPNTLICTCIIPSERGKVAVILSATFMVSCRHFGIDWHPGPPGKSHSHFMILAATFVISCSYSSQSSWHY